MRVVASFITFGVLCILIPPVVSTFLPSESSVKQQILEGADPTLILEQTAAGLSSGALRCDQDRFQFGRAEGGILYVRQLDTKYLVAEVESQLQLFTVDPQGVAVISQSENESDNLKQLALALQVCKQSGEEPVSSGIQISLASITANAGKN